MDDRNPQDERRRPTLDEVFWPWEQVGESRRDGLRHRAALLRSMAWASIVLGAWSLLIFPLGVLGFTLGLATRLMARRDLDLIAAGWMDQTGYHATEKARSDAHAAILLSLMGICVGVTLFAIICWLLHDLTFLGP